MRKIIGMILCFVIGVSLTLAPSSTGTGEQRDSKVETSSVPGAATAGIIEQRNTFSFGDKKLHYMLTFPAEYSQTEYRWPLILFLHGISARGQDLDLVKSYGPPLIAEEQPDFPFVVLAPQCPEEETWMTNADILAALVDDIVRSHRIDPDRVYLTGTSMGGNGTWYLASQHPEYFAAIAPLAAKPTLPDFWSERFISMPIWAFHGDKDTICPLQDDEAMIEALRARGAAPAFTVLPDQGHYISDVYKDQKLYDWFLTHTRQH